MAKKQPKANEESTKIEDTEGFKSVGFKLPVKSPFFLVELPSVELEIEVKKEENETDEKVEGNETEKEIIIEHNYHIFNNLTSAIKEIKKFLKEYDISAEEIQTDIKIISFLKESDTKYGMVQIPWSTIALELIKNI